MGHILARLFDGRDVSNSRPFLYLWKEDSRIE